MSVVGFGQYEVKFGDKEANFATIERLVGEAPTADLLVLPELGATGYDFHSPDEVREHAEVFGDGPTSDLLRRLAAQHNVTMVIGYPELEPTSDKLYNSCMLITPDGAATNYRKIHLFSRENELFTPGDALPPVVETPAGRVGLMICFDWFFPETARVLALAGAQIIAHPSNLVLCYCQRAMYARSVENGVFSITANRVGEETRVGRSLTFTGASQVLDTKGNVLAQAPPDGEFVGLATISAADADNKQINPHNHLLVSRRVDLYGEFSAKA